MLVGREDREGREHRGQEDSLQEERPPSCQDWAASAEDEEIFFIHTAEDALANFQFFSSDEFGNHDTLKH